MDVGEITQPITTDIIKYLTRRHVKIMDITEKQYEALTKYWGIEE